MYRNLHNVKAGDNVKVIGFYPVGGYPPTSELELTYRMFAEQYYNALCTTYRCNLEVIDEVSEAIIGEDASVISLEEAVGEDLVSFQHPLGNTVYLFGNSYHPKLSNFFKTDSVVSISVPNLSVDWPLYGVSTAAIVLNSRFCQRNAGLT